MATRITGIKFDTCACWIRYAWDDSVPQSDRTHTIVEIVAACPFHADWQIGDPFDGRHSGHAENQRKNLVLAHLLENVPKLTEMRVQEDGISTLVFKRGVPAWRFDENRVLRVTTGLNPSEKMTVAQALKHIPKVVFD